MDVAHCIAVFIIAIMAAIVYIFLTLYFVRAEKAFLSRWENKFASLYEKYEVKENECMDSNG